MSLLETYGWSPFFAEAFEPHTAAGRVPARVVATFKHLYRIVTAEGEGAAEVAGRLRHEAKEPEDFPAVGDWVVAAPRPVRSGRPSTRCCPGAGVSPGRPRGPRRASRCWPPTSTPSS